MLSGEEEHCFNVTRASEAWLRRRGVRSSLFESAEIRTRDKETEEMKERGEDKGQRFSLSPPLPSPVLHFFTLVPISARSQSEKSTKSFYRKIA